ncbi:hypothetical protein CK934_09825 [Chitinophaga sp. MD30]|nr:hypothetical protein CK934_09825 [Chitinophaga sp. MD30]
MWHNSQGQQLLNKTITMNVSRQPLANVLQTIGRLGNFTFSYRSNILPADSLVTVSVTKKSVRQVLDQLLDGRCQYKETGGYIILQPKTVALNSGYLVSGYVVDGKTGIRIVNASVYERQQLISTLTNEQGYFKLRLRDRYPAPTLSISKELYADTLLKVTPGQDQELTVQITQVTHLLKPVVIKPGVEKNFLSRMFLSPKQMVQGLNISKFFAKQPYQFSIAPGLGSHGKLSTQVINKVSINLIGGYTAGVNGFELAGVFNIVKKDVKYAQFAGLFNVVGGKVLGVQVAGMHNNVLDSLSGAQIGGLSNMLKGKLNGVQIAGAYNRADGSADGAQLGGLLNVMKSNDFNGVQIAGGGNISEETTKGVQIGSLFNYAGNAHGTQISALANISKGDLKGVQIGLFNSAKGQHGVQVGLINVSDTSSGYSIGIFNIVRKGLHQVSVYSNEITHVNVAYKTGTRRLYSILFVGANVDFSQKAFTFGYGIGKEFQLAKSLALSGEFSSQTVYMGDWENPPTITRLQADIHYRLSKRVTLFGGPAFSIYEPKEIPAKAGYQAEFPGSYSAFQIGSIRAWVGWRVGISLF